MSPIPVTLVTGFLGSGKTTLLNHLLTNGGSRRFAVIENEYGDVGIDGALVDPPSGVLFELNDGCVCCSVRQDLIEVFEQLLERLDEVDHIILETTGLAEPEPVMRLFDIPAIRSAFVLDGVVTVVDAGHLEESLADVSACTEQIAYADVLLLNKIDRVTKPALDAVEARLRSLNPLASIQRTQMAQADVEGVLDLGGRPDDERVPRASSHDHGHDHGHGHGHHHDEAIQSVVVEASGEVDVAALDRWLGHITMSREAPILRMKGILAIPGDPRRFVFHGVRRVVDVRPDRPWEQESRFSRIVFIGRGLDHTALQEGFSSCLSAPASGH
ncbi:MAG: GTP-binding protein [Myxococcota bacterium]|nr:GTP-binding protein [Myxococcota bacterium]